MSKKALVLLNMGGPNNLDEVSLFLKNMFNDKNIITVKSDLLRSIIAFMITKSRTNEAKKNYALLGGKSPLVELTKELVSSLQEKLQDEYRVYFAMRYTPPFAFEAIKQIQKDGIDDVYLIPLYPQYSTTTTKSSIEDFMQHSKNSSIKNVYTIERFYENILYNEAIIDKIRQKIEGKNPQDYELIFSAHSLPQSIVDNGDTYQKEIISNVDILKEMLKQKGIIFKDISIAYQSKLGPMKWLEPALNEVLKSKKDKKVIIYPLSFILDNSETRFELSIEYADEAREVGLLDYLVCECVNSHERFVAALQDMLINQKFTKVTA